MPRAYFSVISEPSGLLIALSVSPAGTWTSQPTMRMTASSRRTCGADAANTSTSAGGGAAEAVELHIVETDGGPAQLGAQTHAGGIPSAATDVSGGQGLRDSQPYAALSSTVLRRGCLGSSAPA